MGGAPGKVKKLVAKPNPKSGQFYTKSEGKTGQASEVSHG